MKLSLRGRCLAILALLLGIYAFARTADGWIRWAGGPSFYPRLDQTARERFVGGANGPRLRALLEVIPPDSGVVWVADQLGDDDWLGIYTLRPRPARLVSRAALRDTKLRDQLTREGWRYAVADLSAFTLPDLALAPRQAAGRASAWPVVFPAGEVTLRGLVALLLVAIAALGCGLSLTAPLLARAGLRLVWTGRAGLGLIAGLGVLGTIGFAAALVGLAGSVVLHRALVALGASLLAVVLYRRRRHSGVPDDSQQQPDGVQPDPIADLIPARLRAPAPLLLAVPVLFALVVPAGRALSEPMHHWDERFQWAFKAKLLAEEGGIQMPSFSGLDSPHLHRHYPLLVPALEAQLAALAGGFAQERAVKGLFPLFFAGFILIGHGLFRLRLGPVSAGALTFLLASVPPLHHATRIQGGQAHTGFADIPLGAFIGGAALLIAARAAIPARRHRAGWLALLAGLFTGWSALCKPEGIVMLAAAPLAMLLASVPRLAEGASRPPGTFARWWKSAARSNPTVTLAAALVLLLPRLLLGSLVPTTGAAGFTGDEDYLSRMQPERLTAGLTENAGRALPALLGAPFTPRWAFVAVLPVLGFLLTRRRPKGHALVPLVLLPLAADFLAYVLTGSTIGWHLAVSLDRLWIQLLLPALGIAAGQIASVDGPRLNRIGRPLS